MGRLTLSELSHLVKEGGLGLVQIKNKADALFLKQTCRMLRRRKSGYQHMSYWISYGMGGKLTFHDGPRTFVQPPYLFRHMEELLEKGMEDRAELELLSMTAKEMYVKICQDMPRTRLERRNPNKELSAVWARLANPVLPVRAKHALFVIAHGLARNKQFMYERWGFGNYVCEFSPDVEGKCAGVPQSIQHIFQQCSKVAEAWQWMSEFIANLLIPRTLGEDEYLNLMYDPLATRELEDTVTWLLGMYYSYIVSETVGNNRVVSSAELQGYLQQSYVSYRQKKGRRLQLPGW